MSSKCSRRTLRIALNADLNIPRAAAYRLALQLEGWADSEKGSAPAMARRLSVPASAVRQARKTLARAAAVAGREERAAAALSARILTFDEEGYPAALRGLPVPPPVLYVRGALPQIPGVAIVGSRRADAYGREAAGWFGRELAARGLAIISGYARGADESAHRGALETEGVTVAVLGSGLDVEYPRGRRRLTAAVIERGAIVTEYPFGTQPLGRNFPIRNRIIAALALGTLVVQATARSGSLITARYAMELGRDLYALPGRIFHDRAIGPNALIRDGALIALHPDDIVDSLPIAVREGLASAADDPDDAADLLPTGPGAELLPLLRPGEPLGADDLAASADLEIEQVLSLLLELELAGRVHRHPGPAFTRAL
jgi:DNA processing protein